MNIKLLIGNIFKKLGLVKQALKFVNKFGYLTHFKNEHASGIDLSFDISSDLDMNNINTVFDVGASIGSMTKKFIKSFPNSKIYAFEPYQKSYEKLSSNFYHYPNVKTVNFALSDTVGEIEMFIQEDTGYNSLSEYSNNPDPRNNNNSQFVNITTLDEYCKENKINNIDFLKIDTEGLEIKVLKGANHLLKKKNIRYIFAECTFDKEYKQNTYFVELYEYLKPFGFKLRAFYDQSTFGGTSYISSVNALFLIQENK